MCVGFVSAYLGRTHETSVLRSRFAVGIRGTTLLDLIRIAAALEMQARPLRLNLDELNQLATPCILHWDLNHFVVLKHIKGDHVTIHDPASGEKRLTFAQVSSHFTGVALELTATPEFKDVKPQPPLEWRQLIGRVNGLSRSLLQLFILAAGLQIVALVSPLFTQWIVDGAIVSGDKDLLWVLGLGFILVLLTRVGMESLRGWLGTVMATQLGTQWSVRVMAILLRLPMSWFETRHTGDVISRFQSIQTIQQTVTGKLIEIFVDGIFGIVVLVVMLVYDAKLAFVVILGVLCYATVRIFPQGAYQNIVDEALAHEALAQSHFIESLRAIQTIKIAGMEEQRIAQWFNLTIEGVNRRVLAQRATLFFSAGYGLIYGIESILVLILGASQVIGGALTVGMLMAFISYKDDFSIRALRLVDNFMTMRMLRLHIDRLSDIISTKIENTSEIASGWIDPKNPVGVSMDFNNVGFRYGDQLEWIFRGVNLKIFAGEHVAIVGPTGCGKTTFAKVILGLLSPSEGGIHVDGLPLTHIGLAAWRNQVGAVMQDDQLLSSTLQDNICGFGEEIDQERMRFVAKLAAIDEEITAMPMGFHTLVGDMGSSLSGGQKQRVLLARALYRQPRILVLDEATSHLDVNKEREVNEAIRGMPITRITIAHRPETIKAADRVIDFSEINIFRKSGMS
ncbi:peptidase domain-containing ABC transporter [Acidovorax sp. GBBC 3334]|nr:peptidase domain-containing ABC transporter [Acidovorax sp. GBBC 3334]